MTFIDLRDREGVVQLVFHPEDAPEAHAAAQALGAEDVVRVTGVVRLRPAGMVNPDLDTGEVEVAATERSRSCPSPTRRRSRSRTGSRPTRTSA